MSNDFEMEVVETDELDSLDSGSNSENQNEPTAGNSTGNGASTREIFGLGAVPDGWSVESLPRVADIEMGSSPPSSTYNEEGEGLPFYQGNADFGYLSPKVSTWCSDPVKTADENDVLISIRAPVGDLNIADEHCCIGRGLAGLRPKEINGLYLFYGLAERSRWLSRLASGSTFKSVSSAGLEKVDLALPPLPEQRKIVSVLYTVDQAIQKTEAIIEQAKRVKRGLMQELFTEGYYQHEEFQSVKVGARQKEIPRQWEVRTIEEISRVKTGHNFSSDIFGENGIPLIKISNIKDGRVEQEEGQDYLRKSDVPEEYVLQENEVLIALSGATTGKTGVIGSGLCPAALNQRVASIESLSVVQNYLNQYLLRKEISKFIRANASASAQKNISKSFLKGIKVPVPPEDEQLKISGILYFVQSTISTDKQRVWRLRRLKKGLMQDLLTGEVRTVDKAIDVLDEVVEHG